MAKPNNEDWRRARTWLENLVIFKMPKDVVQSLAWTLAEARERGIKEASGVRKSKG